MTKYSFFRTYSADFSLGLIRFEDIVLILNVQSEITYFRNMYDDHEHCNQLQ
jgi:hypothetical protein